MSTFKIPEDNMERLEKKLTRIKNKCSKYGIEFSYEIIEELFESDKDDNVHKFFVVDVEGHAVINGWRFVAVIEHKGDSNVIRQYDKELVVPSKYRTALPICEHCNSARNRKDTYLVYNEDSGEFKQVGKSCLADYTKGLSAENVAAFMEGFNIEDYQFCDFSSMKSYIDVEDYLAKAYEVIRIFGFAPSSSIDSTRYMIHICDKINRTGPNRKDNSEIAICEKMNAFNYNPEGEEAVVAVKNILNWIANNSDESSYMSNLKAVCSCEYVEGRDTGILASAPNAYNKAMKREDSKRKAEERKYNSQYIGDVGQKVEANVASCAVVTSFSTQWGVTVIYKFVTDCGDTIIWKTSNYIDVDNVKKVSGRVKELNEFRGEKQTVLTRCKVF